MVIKNKYRGRTFPDTIVNEKVFIQMCAFFILKTYKKIGTDMISDYGLDKMWYPVYGFPQYKVNLVGQVANTHTGRMMRVGGRGPFGSVHLINEEGDRFHCSVFQLMRDSVYEWRKDNTLDG